MSWLQGSQHMGAPPTGANPLNTSQVSYNINNNPQQINSNWNQNINRNQIQETNLQPPQAYGNQSNWIQTNTIKNTGFQPNQYCQNQIQHNIVPSNVSNYNSNQQIMTSQYFDNVSSADGWGDDWEDLDSDLNNQFSTTSQTLNNLASPNQNSVYQQQQQQPQLQQHVPPPMVQPPQMNQTGFPNQNHNVQSYNYNTTQNMQNFTQNKQETLTNQNQKPPQLPFTNVQQPFQKPIYPFYPHTQPQSSVVNQNQNAELDSWNWSIDGNSNTSDNDKLNQNLFQKVSTSAVEKQHSRNVSDASSSNIIGNDIETHHNTKSVINNDNLTSRLPDEQKNTHNLENPMLTRVKRTEHLLTPQWSTESQMSQTSSERSIESDNLDTRSSATNTTSDDHSENNQILNFNKTVEYPTNQFVKYQDDSSNSIHQNKVDQDIDNLDKALMQMNVGVSETQNFTAMPIQNQSMYSMQNIQHETGIPHHSMENAPYPIQNQAPIGVPQGSIHMINQSDNIHNPHVQSIGQHTNFMPPPMMSHPQPPATLNPLVPPNVIQTTPLTHPPLPTASLSPQPGNPFKRIGNSSHKNANLQSQIPIMPAAPMPTNSYPELHSNQEHFLPENSETPEIRNTEIENLEIAPSNDRNQYLQTGHLSEDGHVGDGSENVQENNDNLPPPGLSRLVLGQPESENNYAVSNHSEPPPGLSRMIPGTELPGSNDVNLERQADGQAASITTQPRIPDRNLYQVPGESISHTQRVVPGLEVDRRNIQPSDNSDVRINEQQRELVMEGENVNDEHQTQITSREEPIEGANTLDEIVQSNSHQVETESSVTYDGGRKDVSNPSTANDDSDRDRHRYYNKSRKNEDGSSRKKNKSKERYDSEDTDYSDRDRRRYMREGSSKRDRDRDSYERERYRDRRDGNGRDRYDRGDKDKDRYDRDRYRDRYDRNSRYDTESSKYEDNRDRRRYDRDNFRRHEDRDEEYRKEEKDKKYRSGDRHEDRRRGDREKYRDDRDKDRRRDRRYDYDNSSLNRSDSRNGLDRNHDKDSRRYPQNYYGYGYDPYLYYQQQQQYYENLRRTNPQAYAEWYRKYYGGQMQSQVPSEIVNTDGRESVHSGRSSTNDKERMDNLDISSQLESTSITKSNRLTPCKFTYEHCVSSLNNGLLICLKPNPFMNTNLNNTINIINLSINDTTKKLFTMFPGPLIRGVTHKKTVIEFCEEQIRIGPPSSIVKSRGNSVSSVQSSCNINKPSFVLLWNFLILLLKQNGTVVGADIAELLMKNKMEYPYDLISSKSCTIPTSGRNSVLSDSRRSRENHSPSDENNTEDVSETRNSSEDRELSNSDHTESKKTLNDEEIIEKFRNYLLYGNINEALDWATDNNLWGHALFLASKLDRRAHANVMMKFANKLTLNDPLQTLFQLMSGKIPSAVTSVQDEKWGDWRSHLAMIISNTSQKPELGRKAITTLGDSLYNRGDLFGAQFCYLISEVEFGRYSNVNQDTNLMFNSANTIRLILLGSSHHKSFKEFATNESIMMTEIYEYACTLNDEKFSLVEFQPYKYLLATRMLDYGLQLKTLMYLEQISNHIEKDPLKYESNFIEKVFILADRLKYFDPAFDKTIDDFNNLDNTESHNINPNNIEDQKWLQNLKNILTNSQSQINQLPSNNIGYQYDNYQQRLDYEADMNTDQINKEFIRINQQISELKFSIDNTDDANVNNNNNFNQNQGLMNSNVDNNNIPMYPASIPNDYYEQQSMAVEQKSQIPNDNMNEYYAQQQQQFQQNQNLYGQVPMANESTQQQYNYDMWNAGQQTNNEIPPQPTISMPNSMSNKPGFYDESPTTTTDPSDNKNNSNNNNNNNNNVSGKNKDSSKQTSKDGKNNNQGSNGWFGGIFNKLSLKPKNQMILPDDKNPTIVWDPEKKKWVNKDGGEEEQANFKPPPKLSDISQTQNQNVTNSYNNNNLNNPNTNSNSNIPPPVYDNSTLNNGMPKVTNDPVANLIDTNKVPNLQSNMYKMQRNRTLKKSYVDVFNPSGAPPKPTENILAPVSQLPPVPQSGFFIPGAPMDQNQQHQQQQQSQPDGQPQFYNPNQYTTGGYEP